MKTKLIILIILALSFGLCVSTPDSMANDNQIDQKRERLWNLLQEQKPDYSDAEEASVDPVATQEEIESVDEVVDKVVEGVTESMGSVFESEPAEEVMLPAIDMPVQVDEIVGYDEVNVSGSNLIDLQNDFISISMEKEQVDVNTHWSDDLSKSTVIDEEYRMAKRVEEFAQPIIVEAIETEVIEEAVTQVEEVVSEPAELVEEVVQELVEDVEADAMATMEDVHDHDADYQKAMEQRVMVDYAEPDSTIVYDGSEPVKERKGFWKKLKSSFKGSNEPSRAELNEQFMEDDLEAVDIDSTDGNYGVVMEGESTDAVVEPEFTEYEQMRRILDEKVSADAETVTQDLAVVHQQDSADWDQLAAAVNVVKEPDTYTYKPVENANFTYEEPVYEEVMHEGHMHDESHDEVYQDSEWVEETHDMHDHAEMYTDSNEEPVESFWKKVERKMSMSGMTKEEVQELDYWEVPVEEQTVEDISRNLRIDEAFEEAATVRVATATSQRHTFVQPENKIASPREIIRAAIPEEYRDRKIDLDFDNTNLSDILLIVADTGGMNIVLDPVLKSNTLDLHLKQISLEEALLLIANSYDLGFKLVGDAIFVTENDKLRFENKVSRIIKVRNISVEEAKSLVVDLVDKVSSSDELSSLIVMGDPKDVAKVERIISNIDTPQPQVVLVAKVIEVNKDALKDLGVDWSDQLTIGYQESGRPEDLPNITNADSSFYRVAQLQRSPLKFDATIRMLEQQNKAKVLSEPRVTTLNGKTAEIFVGDEVPYTITNITGGVVTNDVRFVEPGIRLTITPSIIEDDFVVMKVEPEVSFIVAFRGPNDEFPQVRTREATAHVRVENNQPFVLGGILNQEDKQSLFKVPFLGKLPLFGNLFSYEKNTAVDTELIITVIPTIVHGKN